MIRNKLAHEITQIAKTVLPPFAGDEWLNLNLTVLFPSLFLVNPTTMTDEDWRIVSEIKGTALIRFFSNERNPLDITPLLAVLRDHVIQIKPDNNIEIGDYTVQFSWIPNETKDELDYEDKIIPCLLGEFKNAYILQKIAPVEVPNIDTNIFVFFENRTCLPVNIGSAKDMLCHLQLKQVKIAIHDAIEYGYFSLVKSPNPSVYTLPDGNPSTNIAQDANGDIWNLVEIRSYETHDPIKNGGWRVYGLIQADISAIDGDGVGGLGSENLQMTFVKSSEG